MHVCVAVCCCLAAFLLGFCALPFIYLGLLEGGGSVLHVL